MGVRGTLASVAAALGAAWIAQGCATGAVARDRQRAEIFPEVPFSDLALTSCEPPRRIDSTANEGRNLIVVDAQGTTFIRLRGPREACVVGPDGVQSELKAGRCLAKQRYCFVSFEAAVEGTCAVFVGPKGDRREMCPRTLGDYPVEFHFKRDLEPQPMGDFPLDDAE